MAQAMIEPNNTASPEALSTQPHKNTGVAFDFYDLVAELTLAQIRQRDSKRSTH